MGFGFQGSTVEARGIRFGGGLELAYDGTNIILREAGTTRFTFGRQGNLTVNGTLTVTGAQTLTGATTFSAQAAFDAGLNTAAGFNVLIGGTTNPTSGEGVLTLYTASEVGTSAGTGNQVNLFAVSTGAEGGAAATLGYTSSVGVATVTLAAISDTLTRLIPINYNGTALWIYCSTASA